MLRLGVYSRVYVCIYDVRRYHLHHLTFWAHAIIMRTRRIICNSTSVVLYYRCDKRKLTADTENKTPFEPWPSWRPIENNLPIIGPPISFATISTTATEVKSLAWYARSINDVVRPCNAGSSPSLKPQMNNAGDRVSLYSRSPFLL